MCHYISNSLLAATISTSQVIDLETEPRPRGSGNARRRGRTTLKRLRKRLGLHYPDDLTEFWTDRLADLESLPARDFAVRHRVPVQVVLDRRSRWSTNSLANS